MENAKASRLRITLDRLEEGTGEIGGSLRVNNKLPDGVHNSELFKDVVKIAWPSFIELILTQLASMVDLMMVGSIGGKAHPEYGTQALTAVGITNQPKFLLMTAFIAMNVGVTALVARHKGMGNREEANKVVRQGLLFTFCVTIILSAIGIVFETARNSHGFYRGNRYRVGNSVSANSACWIFDYGSDQHDNRIASRRGRFKVEYDL